MNRLNELITNSYRLLTETERNVFEESHESLRSRIRYFDEDGYVRDYTTSYGVFSGASVWLIPGITQDEYEISISGYTFFHPYGCRIKVLKGGEEYDINVAYSRGWLTEEDIATLYEIHSLIECIYY